MYCIILVDFAVVAILSTATLCSQTTAYLLFPFSLSFLALPG